MPIDELDPNLIRARASDGAAATIPDAIDLIIAKINEVIGDVAPPPGGDGDQHFVYTCTGAEGSSFTVPLPAARASVTYIATVQGIVGNLRIYRAPQSGYQLGQITVEASANVQNGDKLAITVADIT